MLSVSDSLVFEYGESNWAATEKHSVFPAFLLWRRLCWVGVRWDAVTWGTSSLNCCTLGLVSWIKCTWSRVCIYRGARVNRLKHPSGFTGLCVHRKITFVQVWGPSIIGYPYRGWPLTHPARYLYSIDGFGAAGTPVKWVLTSKSVSNLAWLITGGRAWARLFFFLILR